MENESSRIDLSLSELKITDIIEVEQLQKMQDVFAEATGVASIITDPEGIPITRPSNFCNLCQLIRQTKKGLANCIHSDAIIGKNNPSGPIMQPCLSGGLWDGGASICIGNRHIANWLIGQVRDRDMNMTKMLDYAREIGADETKFRQALEEVTVMSTERFAKICQALFMFANQISTLAYQNLALRQSENNLQTTLDSIGDAVIATDQHGVIVHMNPIAETLTAWSNADAVGKPLPEIFHIVNGMTRQNANNPVDLVLQSGRVIGLANHTILIDKNGSEHHIADSAAPIRSLEQKITGIVLVFRDVSDQYRLEEQLRHSQKMDAIGQLAGGVAHDFNNMLSGIVGAADLLEHRLQNDPRNMMLAKLIIDATDKAAALTRKLLDFSRKGQKESVPLDISAVITGAVSILERSIDRKIQIVTELNAEHHIVNGDAAQLQNALLNLCINARDAMPNGGVLRVSSTNVMFDAKDCRMFADELKPGLHIEIDVCDTGTGIAPEYMSRLFEPFFTTKELGKGTGLGLAAVYGMIKDHNGAIHVYSELGKGSIFKLFLPASIEDHAAPVFSSVNKNPLPQGYFRVLMIDDEPIVRHTASLVLQDLGCEVVMAEDGISGVAMLEQDPEFNLIILDMIMPGMNGRETYEEIRRIPSNVPVVFSSGFTYNQNISDLMERPDVIGFIQKPYRAAVLEETIRKVRERFEVE